MTLKIYVRDGKTVEEYIQEEVRKGIEQYLSRHGEPVALPEVLSLDDPRCPRNNMIADGFRCGADWMRRELAKLGPLYTHADPGEVEQLREEVEKLKLKVGQAFWDKQDKDDEIKALRKENEALACNLRGKHALAGATYTHLVQERDTLRARIEELEALLRETKSILSVEFDHSLFADVANHIKRIRATLSNSAEDHTGE